MTHAEPAAKGCQEGHRPSFSHRARWQRSRSATTGGRLETEWVRETTWWRWRWRWRRRRARRGSRGEPPGASFYSGSRRAPEANIEYFGRSSMSMAEKRAGGRMEVHIAGTLSLQSDHVREEACRHLQPCSCRIPSSLHSPKLLQRSVYLLRPYIGLYSRAAYPRHCRRCWL